MTVVSVDIETDGRVPGRNSMLQLGAVAFSSKGKELATFCLNLKPLPKAKPHPATMRWWRTQDPAVWQRVTQNPKPPKLVMEQFNTWLIRFNEPAMLFAPTMFDGMFVRWYLETLTPHNAGLHWHRGIDLRSVLLPFTGRYFGNYRTAIGRLTGTHVTNPQPHYALADAREQGQLYFALDHWAQRCVRIEEE